MDTNEQIVKEWLHICKKQFTIENIKFKVCGESGGCNYSDIDILAVDKDGNFYDYEIKWRSTYSLNATSKEKIDNIIKQILRKERLEKIKEFTGDKESFHRLVITRKFFGSNNEKIESIKSKLRENNIEIIFFEDAIRDLISKIEIKGRWDSPILQTIRILKYFNYFQK